VKCIIKMILISLAALFIDYSVMANIARAEDSIQSAVEFKEVWGYLMRGEEKYFDGNEPVTDVCYFACGVSNSGRINTNVNPPSIPELNGQKRRIHIVIADLNGYQLMRKVLNPQNKERDLLVADIIEVSKKFDGVQIDFEAVSREDAANFHEFLSKIKEGLEPDKIFSVALPARVSYIENDAYDYGKISGIVDKVYIMAYDQHWSTSKPGPVASLSWCRDIVSFAKEFIPVDKLIMGIPLYGRLWEERYIKGKTVKVVEYKKVKGSNKKTKVKKVVKTVKIPPRVEKFSKSVKTKHLPEIASSKKWKHDYSIDKGLCIKKDDRHYSAVLYCDDLTAIKEKFLLYKEHVQSIGFWRLGMQSDELWREITYLNKIF